MSCTKSVTESRSSTRSSARLVVPKISYFHPGLLARGMLPKRLAGNPRELPISSHTKRNASYTGRYVIPRVDRRDHGEMASSLMTP